MTNRLSGTGEAAVVVHPSGDGGMRDLQQRRPAATGQEQALAGYPPDDRGVVKEADFHSGNVNDD